MKTFSLSRRLSAWLMAGLLTLFPLVDGSQAFGGGASAGGAGVAGGVGAGGGGGHGGGVSGASGGHAGGGVSSGFGGSRAGGFSGGGQHLSAGFSGGHAGGLVPTGFPSQSAGITHANGGFARSVTPGYNTAARTQYVGRAGGDGFGTLNGRGFNGGYRTNSALGNRLNASALNGPRIRNAWTEPDNPHVTPAARASRYGYNNGAYDEDRSVLQNRLGTGQHLYPGASDYSALTANHTHAWQGEANRGGSRSYNQNYNRHTRDAYNQFYFTSAYFPYLYGSFFPAYNGYYDNGYLGEGLGTYLDNGDASLNSNYGTPVFNEATGPYIPTDGSQYNDQNNAAPQSTPPTDDTLPPDQPASVGPQNPPAAEERESKETGPDTLVESVQNELAKRGYYGGKVDSMYNDTTRTALRRFQTDQHLAVTGRINEATLHALQLD